METFGVLSLVKDVYVPLPNFRRFTAIVTTTDTLDVQINQAQDAAGTGAKIVPGVTLSATGAGMYVISGSVNLLDSAQVPGSEFDHVALIVTSGTVTVIGLFGEEPLYLPTKSVVAVVGEVVLMSIPEGVVPEKRKTAAKPKSKAKTLKKVTSISKDAPA